MIPVLACVVASVCLGLTQWPAVHALGSRCVIHAEVEQEMLRMKCHVSRQIGGDLTSCIMFLFVESVD